MSERRIVITGMGLVTGLGNNLRSNWDHALKGKSAIDYLDMEGIPSIQLLGSKVRSLDTQTISGMRKQIKLMREPVKFAVVATQEALTDSKLLPYQIDPVRIGIFIGTGSPHIESEFLFPAFDISVSDSGRLNIELFARYGIREINPFFLLIHLPNAAIYFLSQLCAAKGVNNNFISDEIASLHAIKTGYDCIKSGMSEICICCGYDSLINLAAISKYDRSGKLTKYRGCPSKAIRPFDLKRDGFAVGEGAGVIILESLENALKRNAQIYAEIIGCSIFSGTNDSLSELMANAIEDALRKSGVVPRDINYICLHGEATQKVDFYEAIAIKEVFGQKYQQIPVSSIKPLTGYMGAASGIAETVFAILSIHYEKIPPLINYTTPDPECDLNFVTQMFIKREIKVALISFIGESQAGVIVLRGMV